MGEDILGKNKKLVLTEKQVNKASTKEAETKSCNFVSIGWVISCPNVPVSSLCHQHIYCPPIHMRNIRAILLMRSQTQVNPFLEGEPANSLDQPIPRHKQE